MASLRIAVVGAGAVSEIYHLPALARSPHAVLGAIVDADPARAADVARRFGAVTALRDPQDLRGKVDAAIIATPNALHADIACTLLDEGIHVLCEKPLATTLADAQRMVAAASKRSSRLMAGHCRRFNPNAQLLQDLVASGVLGSLRRLTAGLGSRYGQWPTRTDFRRQRTVAGGGVMMDMGVHLIDLALWIAGAPGEVTSYAAEDRLGFGMETDVELTIGFPEGAAALLSCSYTHGLNRTLRVEGSEGWAETSVDGVPAVTLFSRRARLCARAGAQQFLVDEVDPYQRQLDHFVDCVLSDRPFLVRQDEVLAGLGIIERCYRQARAA